MDICIHRSNRLIQFYHVGVFYCSQACLKYCKIMYYRNTRQSKNINFIWWYPDKHSQQQQIDIVFSRRCIQEHSEFCVIIFLFFEDYINFSLWFCWLRQQTVVYLEQPQNTFFIPVLLTGAQLNLVSYLLFISVFDEVDITFWVRLTNSFLKNKLPSQNN